MTSMAGKRAADSSIRKCVMPGVRRVLLVASALAVFVVSGIAISGHAVAQQQQQQAAPPQPPAAPELRQVRLNEKQVQGFLGAQKDLVAITAKLEAAGDTIDEKLQKELDDIGRKHGFKDFADFEEIRGNIMLVLAGIEPDTGEYSDPIELIKKDIEAIKADKTLSAEDRKAQLEEMDDALKEMQPLKFKENIDVVKKYAKQIDEVLK